VGIGGEGFEGRGPFYERVDLLGGQEARLKVIAVRPSARRRRNALKRLVPRNLNTNLSTFLPSWMSRLRVSSPAVLNRLRTRREYATSVAGDPPEGARMRLVKGSEKTPRGSLTHFLPLFAPRSCHASETGPAPSGQPLPVRHEMASLFGGELPSARRVGRASNLGLDSDLNSLPGTLQLG
jgi:hypothetical protein